MEIIKAIPTNIITGFLGVGKTTAIQYLLQQKTENQRIAVLVNEFGEMGIDGTLLKQDNVFIKEVPGGCLCCAAGLTLQVALNQLLRQAKPDRILIEPTGLGHPHEIIKILTQPPYDKNIHLYATITLVDARKIQDNRYTGHEIFNQQLQVADIIIANKADLYNASDLLQLQEYLIHHQLSHIPLYQTNQAKLKLEWLSYPKQTLLKLHHHSNHHNFISQSITFNKNIIFSYEKLYDYFNKINTMRLKAIIKTDKGDMAFNKIGEEMQTMCLEFLEESRIVIISEKKIELEFNKFYKL